MSPSLTQSPNDLAPVRRPARSGSATLLGLGLAAALLASVLTVSGCGGDKKAKDDILLAKVGDKEILGSYYEDRLSLLKQEELPRDDQGQIADMSQQAGKEKFLETLINKEVMAQTAMALGYQHDPQIEGARVAMLSYEAGLAMWANEVAEPANTISEEQLQAFYARLGSSRQCRYVITNFLDDAQAARKLALTGVDWQDVVDKYHDGDPDPLGKYEISVPFGRYSTDYEEGVFGPAIGEITQPISTAYGFWILKIDGEKPGKKPALEEAKAQILDVTRGRVISKLRDEFKDKVREKYKFQLNEDALWKCYQGLPDQEDLFYPGTKDPVRKEDLSPLAIATPDLDLTLFTHLDGEGKEVVYTLGEYKALFDAMSVFQRPKRAEMLGGLRNKVSGEVDRALLDYAAKDLGYFDDDVALLKVGAKREQMLVGRLYEDTVKFKEVVDAEELANFWAEHESEYFMPETRNGRLVVCSGEAQAEAARAAIEAGVEWRDVMVQFDTDKDNKARAGKIEKLRADGTGAAHDALFALGQGGVSPVFAIGDGRFGVVVHEETMAPRQLEMAEVSQEVGARIKRIREDEAFQAQLVKWKKDLTIVTYPEDLAGLKSWHDLTVGPVPENLVPRN
jgi:peptidyl-prolyl cis-trans isomerase C